MRPTRIKRELRRTRRKTEYRFPSKKERLALSCVNVTFLTKRADEIGFKNPLWPQSRSKPYFLFLIPISSATQQIKFQIFFSKQYSNTFGKQIET